MASMQGTDQVLSRNNVSTIGQGRPPMVMVHGFGGARGTWAGVAPRLADNHRVTDYDLSGSGHAADGSYDRVRHADLWGHAQDLVEVCDATGTQDGVLIGHGVGGTIGMLACIRRPDLFSELVLISPNPCPTNREGYRGGFDPQDLDALLSPAEDPEAWAERIAPFLSGRGADDSATQAVKGALLEMEPEDARHFARVAFHADHRADLARVQTPTLILQAKDDPLSPPHVARYLQRRIRDCHIQTLEATGHAPHLTAPEETTRAIRDYVDRLR